MPSCRIDLDRSPSYRRGLKAANKKFRRASEYLAQAFGEIEKDYETACHANPIPGFAGQLWKYRCGNPDAGSGRRSGFRIICYLDNHDPGDVVLFPIYLYWKGKTERVPDVELLKAIRELQAESE